MSGLERPPTLHAAWNCSSADHVLDAPNPENDERWENVPGQPTL
jgi:hypothetical protein